MTISVAMSNWGWPQYVYMALALLTVVGKISLHGKSQEFNGYAGVSGFLITFFLLVAGGFYA